MKDLQVWEFLSQLSWVLPLSIFLTSCSIRFAWTFQRRLGLFLLFQTCCWRLAVTFLTVTVWDALKSPTGCLFLSQVMTLAQWKETVCCEKSAKVINKCPSSTTTKWSSTSLARSPSSSSSSSPSPTPRVFRNAPKPSTPRSRRPTCLARSRWKSVTHFWRENLNLDFPRRCPLPAPTGPTRGTLTSSWSATWCTTSSKNADSCTRSASKKTSTGLFSLFHSEASFSEVIWDS